eukprot:12602.XXX_566487_566711_1 [CDS] Oithona nana genome sequencing.
MIDSTCFVSFFHSSFIHSRTTIILYDLIKERKSFFLSLCPFTQLLFNPCAQISLIFFHKRTTHTFLIGHTFKRI